MAVDPLTSGQPPEYVQEQLFQEINEWINARFPLDNELTLIGESVNAIIARLALIQRDDGEIANESVGYDQLKPEVVPGGIGLIEGWVDMRQYEIRDSVFYNNSWYVCKLGHTASPENRPDVDVPEGETEGTYWVLINDFSALFEEVIMECETLRDQAQEWAQAPEDQPVNDGTNPVGFSAFHWAEKAAETVAGIQPDLDQLQANIDAEEAARIAADDAITSEVDTNRVKKIAGTTGTPDTGAAEIPTGTTVQAPAGTTTALLRFDMDLSKFRGFNPVKGEYTDIGGGGLVEVEIVTEDFQVEAGKVYGIDLSTNDVITGDVPGGFDENDWFGIIDIGNAFDDSHGCVIQLTTEEFVIADPDNAFYAGETNSFYAFQKVNGKYILGQSSYGQDATYIQAQLDSRNQGCIIATMDAAGNTTVTRRDDIYTVVTGTPNVLQFTPEISGAFRISATGQESQTGLSTRLYMALGPAPDGLTDVEFLDVICPSSGVAESRSASVLVELEAGTTYSLTKLGDVTFFMSNISVEHVRS